MKATQILKHEHQAILFVIAAVEAEIASIGKTGRIHAKTVRDMADFFKNFVDRCHHAKEEKHLFVMMHEQGMPTKAGLLAVLLNEHKRGRALVRGIAAAVAGRRAPGAPAIRKVRQGLKAYAQLLRSHIDKEDNVLYALAAQVLRPADQRALGVAFDKVESGGWARVYTRSITPGSRH